MKLHVVFSKDGEIVAAVQLDGAGPVRARPVPDEQAGQRATDVYVPAEYRHYDLAGICKRMRVDVKAKVPNLKVKE